MQRGPETPQPEPFRRLSRQIADSFMDAHLRTGSLEEDYVRLLCEMATFSRGPELARPAARVLFTHVIERLCDEFEELQTEAYNRVMALVIGFCRRLPEGRELDRRLRGFAIHSEQDLLGRVAAIRSNHRRLGPHDPIRRVLLLSRVTIGADVAITSVIVQRLRHAFPAAEMVLVGGSNLRQVYGGNPALRFAEVAYDRGGGLLERLATWHAVLKVVERETAGTPPEETLLVDPDSRLSQLGVLPLIDIDRYLFFSSRSAISPERIMTMAEFCNAWLDNLLGETRLTYPRLWLPPAATAQAHAACRRLKADGARRVITVNFGVGGNARKRVGAVLEQKLVLALLKEPQTVILLDLGSGPDEERQARRLLQAVAEQGYATGEAGFAPELSPALSWGAIVVRSGIGEMAAIVAASDEYIGYDSAGQHIAAAAGTPCVTIFAGSNNMRFIRRWRAFGKNHCQIVHVDTLNDPSAVDAEDIVTRVMNERHAAGGRAERPAQP
jgi:ADP-heptose:LPS heptosyltransferase